MALSEKDNALFQEGLEVLKLHVEFELLTWEAERILPEDPLYLEKKTFLLEKIKKLAARLEALKGE